MWTLILTVFVNLGKPFEPETVREEDSLSIFVSFFRDHQKYFT